MASDEDDTINETEPFDTDSFINAVRSFPCVWNYKDESYSNRGERYRAWAAITKMFTPNFDQKSTKEKNISGVKIQKKWKLLRDNFNRYEKKNTTNNGTGSSTFRPCIYHQQLLFLKGLQDRGERSSNSTATLDKPRKRITRKKKVIIKRKQPESSDEELIEELAKKLKKHEKNERDEDRLFLLSLCNDFKKIPEHLKLDAKADFIAIIKRYTALCQLP